MYKRTAFVPSHTKYHFDWSNIDLNQCLDHDEPCPRCGQQKLKKDPIGGFYLKCFGCGWEGW